MCFKPKQISCFSSFTDYLKKRCGRVGELAAHCRVLYGCFSWNLNDHGRQRETMKLYLFFLVFFFTDENLFFALRERGKKKYILEREINEIIDREISKGNYFFFFFCFLSKHYSHWTNSYPPISFVISPFGFYFTLRFFPLFFFFNFFVTNRLEYF